VLAALAACTSITVRMYAARKQWPLEGIDVTVEYAVRERDRNELARRVVLHGPLDAAQRARLLQVAEACPVHRLLTGAVSIRTDAG
jgi:putative redox protein